MAEYIFLQYKLGVTGFRRGGLLLIGGSTLKMNDLRGAYKRGGSFAAFVDLLLEKSSKKLVNSTMYMKL